MVFKKGWKKDQEPKAEVEKVVEPKTEAPIHTAFYIEKTGGKWLLNIAKVQGDKIISKKVKEGMNKAHSLEEFKIAFSTEYYFGK